MAGIAIGGILRHDSLALLSVLGVPDRPGVAARIFGALGREGISAHFVVQCIDHQGQDHVVFCVEREECERALDVARACCQGLGTGSALVRPEVASIAIFGPDFRQRPGIAGAMFSALAAEGINILAISTSISTVSCIIDAGRAADAERVLRAAFVLPE
ncbi:MAG: ACT domain-containing protein [Anaerolineae bacterium]|nr:ACT domain-containing protein [Anaerolineae bacterium]